VSPSQEAPSSTQRPEIAARPLPCPSSSSFAADPAKAGPAKAKAAYDEEDKKLQADEKYKELAKNLTAFQSSLKDGELGKKLKALESEEARVTVKFQEADQRVKDVKSELEEAWYEHDHAVQQKRNPKPYLEAIAELDKKKEQLDKARERETRLALIEIVQKMREYGITLHELIGKKAVAEPAEPETVGVFCTTDSWWLLDRLRRLGFRVHWPGWVMSSVPLPGLDRYLATRPARLL